MITGTETPGSFNPALSPLESDVFSIIVFAGGRLVGSAEIISVLNSDGSHNNPKGLGVLVQRINQKSTTGPVITAEFSRGYRYEST